MKSLISAQLIDVRQFRVQAGLKLMFAAIIVMSSSIVGFAQDQRTAQYQPSARVMDYWVTRWEKMLVDVAEAMPADKYSFAPTAGEFKGVRTFGQQLKHAAAANYILAAAVLGQDPPADAGDETGPDTVHSKAEIISYLKGSFALLHKAAQAIDATNVVIKAPPISPLQTNGTRLGLVVEALQHSINHYGQLVEYLRMNGLIPPASR